MRDRGHADEVVGAREERRKGRGERFVATDAQADRRCHHLLLGDEHLEVAARMGLGEGGGGGGVAALAVEGDDARVAGAESGHGVAVGSAGGGLVTSRMARTRY